jgi:hypothetical protein
MVQWDINVLHECHGIPSPLCSERYDVIALYVGNFEPDLCRKPFHNKMMSWRLPQVKQVLHGILLPLTTALPETL